MSVTITTEHGVETRTEDHTEGLVQIATYHPHTCPWDCYINKQAGEWRRVLGAAGVDCETPVTHQRNLSPMGSGPGGRVRFGDDMMPGHVSLYVAPGDVGKASAALAAHKEAIRLWLHEGGPMPEACRG